MPIRIPPPFALPFFYSQIELYTEVVDYVDPGLSLEMRPNPVVITGSKSVTLSGRISNGQSGDQIFDLRANTISPDGLTTFPAPFVLLPLQTLPKQFSGLGFTLTLYPDKEGHYQFKGSASGIVAEGTITFKYGSAYGMTFTWVNDSSSETMTFDSSTITVN